MNWKITGITKNEYPLGAGFSATIEKDGDDIFSVAVFGKSRDQVERDAKLIVSAPALQKRVEELESALKSARQTLAIAIEVNTPDGFDVREHVTIKKIDEALNPKS